MSCAQPQKNCKKEEKSWHTTATKIEKYFMFSPQVTFRVFSSFLQQVHNTKLFGQELEDILLIRINRADLSFLKVQVLANSGEQPAQALQ